LKEDERAKGGGKRAPISKARKRAVGIFISCLGLVLTGSHLISELLEEGSLTGLLEHLAHPPLIFFHCMVFLSIPAFMLTGYFYQKQQKLIENLEERTRELKEAQEQLLKSERLAAIGELAAMVGHDLRNPLQAITNASYVVNELVKKMDFAGEKFSLIPPSLRKEMFDEYTQLTKMMGIIDESTEYANKIVSDLRDFARTKEPELTEVDLESLIQETLSGISIPEKVRASIRPDQALSKLYIDPTQMRRVFTNLTTNAIQAMPNGGELTISTSLKNGFVSIAFQDTGVGIPKEDIEKLFTPLFTRKSKGLGLGLPICKNTVEAHGGSIEVESQEGKGSTFTVKLPVKKGGEANSEEGKHPECG